MNANLICAVICTAATAFGAFAAENTPAKPKLTPEERRARREARLAAAGGLIDLPVVGHVVRIKLETDKVTPADLEKTAADMRRVMHFAVEVVGRGQTSTNSVGALVLVAEKGKESPALLCAPEENWSVVNLSRLWEDGPDAETAKTRVRKEVWRALGFAAGAGNAPRPPCLMRNIRKPSDLDKDKIEFISPQPLMGMLNTMSQIGFAPGGQTTYRKACEQGWAPAPTNDVQKAIWKEIHTPPEAPLQLKK